MIVSYLPVCAIFMIAITMIHIMNLRILRRIILGVFIVACLCANGADAVDGIMHIPCPGEPTNFSLMSAVTWLHRDESSSIISYKICSARPHDLRFADNLQLSLYNNQYKSLERSIRVCQPGANCVHDGCIAGSIVTRIPYAKSRENEESIVTLNEQNGFTLLRLCSSE